MSDVGGNPSSRSGSAQEDGVDAEEPHHHGSLRREWVHAVQPSGVPALSPARKRAGLERPPPSPESPPPPSRPPAPPASPSPVRQHSTLSAGASPARARSEGTLTTLYSCRRGYTSPRLRDGAELKRVTMTSVWDAAYEGDVEGLHGILQLDGRSEDLNRLGYLQAYNEGLVFDVDQPLQGFQTRSPPPSLRKPRRGEAGPYAATPLMFAIAARRTETVAYLLRRGADVGACADVMLLREGRGTAAAAAPHLCAASARTVAFASTFFKCQGAHETQASRALKALVCTGEAPLATLSREQLVTFVGVTCGVTCRDNTFGGWSAEAWVGENAVTGETLETWLCCDWKQSGINKIGDLRKLLPKLLHLITHPPPGAATKEATPAPAPEAAEETPGDSPEQAPGA